MLHYIMFLRRTGYSRQVIDFKITRMPIVFQKYTFRVLEGGREGARGRGGWEERKKRKKQCNVYTILCADIGATKSDIENRRDVHEENVHVKMFRYRSGRTTVPPQKYARWSARARSHEKLRIIRRVCVCVCVCVCMCVCMCWRFLRRQIDRGECSRHRRTDAPSIGLFNRTEPRGVRSSTSASKSWIS